MEKKRSVLQEVNLQTLVPIHPLTLPTVGPSLLTLRGAVVFWVSTLTASAPCRSGLSEINLVRELAMWRGLGDGNRDVDSRNLQMPTSLHFWFLG